MKNRLELTKYFAELCLKTAVEVRPRTTMEKGKESIKTRLPYWGHVSEIRKIFYE
jgi:hypothetical protein